MLTQCIQAAYLCVLLPGYAYNCYLVVWSGEAQSSHRHPRKIRRGVSLVKLLHPSYTSFCFHHFPFLGNFTQVSTSSCYVTVAFVLINAVKSNKSTPRDTSRVLVDSCSPQRTTLLRKVMFIQLITKKYVSLFFFLNAATIFTLFFISFS